VAPIKTLKLMSQSDIAGLDDEHLMRQSEQLKRQLETIMDSPATPIDQRKKCVIITYDGECTYPNSYYLFVF